MIRGRVENQNSVINPKRQFTKPDMKYGSCSLVQNLKYEMYHEQREDWMEIVNLSPRLVQCLNRNSLF